MEFTRALGFVLAAVALLLAAWLIRAMCLWSNLANHTLPWFCSAVAVAILIVGVVSLLSHLPPGSLPVTRVALSWLAVMLVFGIGMVVDYCSYPAANKWLPAVGEWIGFGVVLAGAFWVSRPVKTITAQLTRTEDDVPEPGGVFP